MKYHSLGCSINTAIWAPNNQLIATGADDGQIKIQTPKGELLHTQQAYSNRNVPVNSLHFTDGLEFLYAGLQDGVIKIWDSKKKDFVRLFRSSTNSISSITCAQFNNSNMILAASNLKGYINAFPMNDLLTRDITSNFSQTPISEIFSLKATDSKVNSIRFSPFKENILACAQDDSGVSLFDFSTQKVMAKFNNHKGSVRGVCFSTISKLLLCSAGLDKYAYFYDIQSKMSVNKINLNMPIQSVSFAQDGKTVAFGANSQGTILVYDLRNSKEPLMQLDGHKHTVHAIQFKHKESTTKSQQPQPTFEKTQTDQPKPKTPETDYQAKTLDQLKEEAKRNVDMKLQKMQNQRQNVNSVLTEAQSVTTNFSDRGPTNTDRRQSQEGGVNVSGLTHQKLVSLEERKLDKSQEKIQQNQYVLNLGKQQQSPKTSFNNQSATLPTQFNLQKQESQETEKRQLQINVEDTEMKLDDIQPNEDIQPKFSNQKIDLVQDLEVNQDQRQLIEDVVDKKFQSFSNDVQSLINNFHIEIIRQFEIQKVILPTQITPYQYQIDGVIKDYMLDPSDDLSEPEEIEIERDLVDEEDELDAYLE